MLQKLIYSLAFLSSLLCLNAQSPAIEGYHVYYGHLHNHSNVSDGTGTDDNAYNYAKNTAGLDYFSTANHAGSIDPSEWILIKAAADKYNEDGVFTAFWGFEWSADGHIAVINTDDYPGISEDPSGTLVELCTWLEARNGVAFFNHPNRGAGKVFGGFSSPPCYKIVGMELFNGTADYSMHYYNDGYWPDDGNLNHFAEANSRGWRIGASGSDDNHAGTWGTRTDYRMAILSKHLSRPELLEAMQARRFYSTLDKNLVLSFQIDSIQMGSFLEGGEYDVHIQARDLDEEAFTRVMLFRDGLEIHTWNIDTTEVDLTLPLSTFDGEFFYIKITQADGDEAVSSPIYIKGGAFNIRPTCSLSTPENGTHFAGPQLITISAEASDADGTVASVEFFVDGSSLGTDTVAPFTVNYMIPANGSYEITAKAKDNSGSWTNSSPRTFTVGIFSKTESSGISDGMNDVEENADGSMYTNSSDIELVYDGSNQSIGLRFTGMGIPPGAAIQSAYIQFTVDEASAGACVLSIKGHAADDSQPFSNVNNSVSGRPATSAEVIWEPADWTTVGASGPDQRTPDLSSIVREIVNRPGYTQSSAISFIVTGTGERVAESYEGNPGSAALLTVDYSFGMESSDPAPRFDEASVRIYPNPVANGMVTVEVDGGPDQETRVSIMDIAGRTCHRGRIENGKTVIDVSGLGSGLYIMNLSNDRGAISRKLIVE